MNIAYHSGVGMEQEASWVGLGWSLTPGAINRNLKGLPDDFKADNVKFMRKMKPNHTIGLDLKLDPEAFGFELSGKAKQIFGDKQKLSLGVGVTYNNYTGVDINKSVAVSFSNGMINPSIGYSDNGGLSLSAKPSLAAVAKNREKNSEGGTNFLGKLSSFVALDGEISWNSTSGLGMSASRPVNLGKLSKYVRTNKVSGGIELNNKVYSPGSDVSMWNYGFRVNVGLGKELFGGDVQGQADFFYNVQRLGAFGDESSQTADVATWNLKAYGSQYAHESENGHRNDLLDFNREHEYPLRGESPLLPVTQLTYDVFSVSGQGTGGSFRNYRNDYPIVGKNRTTDMPNTQVNIGLDIAEVSVVKIGGNGSLVFANSSNGYWNSGAASAIGFEEKDQSDWLYEPSYFKKGGEFGAFDEKYLTEIGGEDAVRFNLTSNSTVSNNIKTDEADKGDLQNDDFKNHRKYERAARASSILSLTKKEAYNYGFPFSKDKHNLTTIRNYSGSNNDDKVENGAGYANSTELNRLNDMPGDEHHYGEFQITQDNGYTYVYGLPVYNHETVEASFAINKPATDPNNITDQGYVEYAPEDPTAENEKGRDNFVSRKEIGEYAHSFLLTQILSPDYVDVKGDGITDDDIGEAVIFNYEKVHDSYGWRNPMSKEENRGRYIEGLKTLDYDDKASFVYGTKEVWVLHSIESRNMVAEFFTSDREDSYGVLGESGVRDMTQSQRKLDRIELYNKIERAKASTAENYKATPIKVIHFKYNYSLCQGVTNSSNDGGKLTLTELSFSHGNSGMGLLNPYKFEYSDFNPSYNPLETDRWGNYMAFDNDLPNHVFPYVKQDKSLSDQYASAWLLKKIELPSGGEINVEYESDDYAHVMEKNALSMVKLAGVGKTETFTAGNKMFEAYGAESNFLYFELPGGTYEDHDDVRADFKPEGALYFKALFHVKEEGAYNSKDKEYVSGYVKIKDVGLCPWTSGQKYGYVEIEEKRDRNTKYQAMSHAAWKMMLGNLSERVNDIEQPTGDLLEDGKDYIKSNLSKITQLLKGQMGKMKSQQYAQYIDLERSIIRLKEHSGFKLGGGSRVKQISMNDSWDQMTSSEESSAEYGSVYTYTNNGVSSGVAAYEPMMGSEENPYKQPIYYNYRPKSIMGLVKAGKPVEEYVVGPYGEMFFPGASVGYSKVTVHSLATAKINAQQITGTPTGYTTSEFYTARDFPIIQDKTVPQSWDNNLGNAIGRKFTGNAKTELAMSQGYSFILNNMHGKPKKTGTFNQFHMPISSQEFVYKTDVTDSRRLDNHVDILSANGTVETDKQIGVEVDFVADAHESINNSYETRVQPGADAFSLGIPPFIVIPNLWFEFKSSSTNLRYISNTKVIYKYGILDRVIAKDERSEVTTKNLLWDAESGQVLLTRTQNEFESDLENLKIPAHMSYSGMEGAYKNLNIELKNISVNNGLVTVSGKASDYFEPGDEIILGDLRTGGNTVYTRAWVLDINDADDKIYLIDRMGRSISPSSSTTYEEFRLLRSGKRNQTSEPILKVTEVGDLTSQIVAKEIVNPLQVSSAEYSDEWGTYCDRLIEENCDITDDLRLILNCLWTEGHSNSQYDDDIGINLDNHCPVNLQTNIKQQTLNMSDITVNVHTSTSKIYYKYTLELDVANPDIPGIEADLFSLGRDPNDLANEDLWIDDETVAFISEPNPDLNNPPNLLDADIFIGSFTDYGSGSPSWLETMLDQRVGVGNYTITGPATDVYLDKKYVAVEKHQAPWFKFLTQQTTSEILIGVGGIDTWDDVNYTWDRDGSMPKNPSCTLKLIPLAPATAVNYADIDEFTDMVYDENASYVYTLTANMGTGGTQTFGLNNTCLDLMWCELEHSCGQVIQGKIINPFLYGVRGNWRQKNSYAYHTTRSSSLTPGAINSLSHTDIRGNGQLEGFSLDIFGTPGTAFSISGDRWISPTMVTEYAPGGSEVEVVDPLGRYSSEIFGYDRRLVIASAQNSPHHNIAFDGFEEYTYPYHGDCKKKMHWAMSQYVGLQVCSAPTLPLSNIYRQVNPNACGQSVVISDNQAHTGHYSLKVEQGLETVTFSSDDHIRASCTQIAQQDVQPFALSNCDCIGAFEPDGNSKYYFSAWVMETQIGQPKTYENAKINIKVYDNNSVLIYSKQLEPSGPIIEGWQRISGDFEIPVGNDLVLRTEIEVGTNTMIDDVYLDDVRIQPFNSQMKTFVYDQNSLKLSSELDASNFATIYEYDDEGRLLRVKKETENGIMTIQESRYGISQ